MWSIFGWKPFALRLCTQAITPHAGRFPSWRALQLGLISWLGCLPSPPDQSPLRLCTDESGVRWFARTGFSAHLISIFHCAPPKQPLLLGVDYDNGCRAGTRDPGVCWSSEMEQKQKCFELRTFRLRLETTMESGGSRQENSINNFNIYIIFFCHSLISVLETFSFFSPSFWFLLKDLTGERSSYWRLSLWSDSAKGSSVV